MIAKVMDAAHEANLPDLPTFMNTPTPSGDSGQ
jgi:hypothetical protein